MRNYLLSSVLINEANTSDVSISSDFFSSSNRSIQPSNNGRLLLQSKAAAQAPTKIEREHEHPPNRIARRTKEVYDEPASSFFFFSGTPKHNSGN